MLFNLFKVKPPEKKLRVCFATSTGGYDHARTLDAVLAQAVNLRGADVDMLLCDAALPGCQMTKMGRATPQMLEAREALDYCKKCVKLGSDAYKNLGFPLRLLSEYITKEEAEEAKNLAETTPFEKIREFTYEELPVGDHSHAGVLRYFARGDLANEEMGEIVLRRYFESGLRTIHAITNLIREQKYDVIVIHHGIYIPQGMICEVARKHGVRVVSYNPAYRKHSFIFSHDLSYHFTMLDEPVEHWRNLKFTPQLEQDVKRYLQSRRFGTNDWIWFHDKPQEDIKPVLRELGADPEKPYIAMLTSVVWDAQLHYKTNAFPSMMDWIYETIEAWGKRSDDLQLIIRVHPAEVRGLVPSRQKVVEEVARKFPALPKNVFILPPENQASTYALGEHANAVIIYNTKTGVEMTAMGVPVIVAGEAWVRGKGFTQDASSREQYFELLQKLPRTTGMTDEEKELAMKYAYHFFFRRMIPLPFIHPVNDVGFEVKISGKQELEPGNWPGLDTICDGIMKGTPFIYPAETLEVPFPGEMAA